MALLTQAPTAPEKKALATHGAMLLKMFHDEYNRDSKGVNMEYRRGQVTGWRQTLYLLYGEHTGQEIVEAAAEEANLTVPPAGSIDDDGNWLGFDCGASTYIGKLHE